MLWVRFKPRTQTKQVKFQMLLINLNKVSKINNLSMLLICFFLLILVSLMEDSVLQMNLEKRDKDLHLNFTNPFPQLFQFKVYHLMA